MRRIILEKEVSAIPIGIIMECDKCKGSMEFLGEKNFRQKENKFYLHECTSCHKQEWFSIKYPFVKFSIESI